MPPPDADALSEGDKISNQSIRVNVDTLEHLTTMVSELVLTRNQSPEISRRHEDTEFTGAAAAARHRHRRVAGWGLMKTRMQPVGTLSEAAAHRARPGPRTRQADRLEMHVAGTELERQVLELLSIR